MSSSTTPSWLCSVEAALSRRSLLRSTPGSSAAVTFAGSVECGLRQRGSDEVDEVVRVHRSSGGSITWLPARVLTPTRSTPYDDSYFCSNVWNGPVPISAVSRPPAKVSPSTQRRMVGELLADERIGARGGVKNGHVPAGGASSSEHRRDRRRPAPDEQSGRVRSRARGAACGPRSSASEGSVSSIATDERLRENADRQRPFARARRSRSRRAGGRPSGLSG